MRKYKKAIIIGGVAVLLLFVVGAFAEEPEQAPQPNKAERGQAVEEKQTEKPKEWQKVIELSGNTHKRSASFSLEGGETRLNYAVNGDDYSLASIYVVEEGKSLDEVGGFPEVSATPGSDQTRLTKPAGKYYVDVNSANANWSIVIEELK